MVINSLQPQIFEVDKSVLVARPSVTILIPTYCEEKNIEKLVREIQKLNLSFTILIIDDSSPDKTQEIIRVLINEYNNIFLISRPTKLGLGTAITDGFQVALTLDPLPDYIITMDSDFSHNPKDIPRLLKSAESGNDLVIGSRYICGGKMKNWTFNRKLISRFANILASIIIGTKTQDYTSGFRCYSINCVKKTLKYLSSTKFEIQVETIKQAKINNFKTKEIPITFVNRKNGKSKLSSGEFIAFLIYITKSWITNLTDR